MKTRGWILIFCLLLALGCNKNKTSKSTPIEKKEEMQAKEILGNKAYRAISYGGYRMASREHQPTISEIKEDLRILSALGIKILRTYNVQLPHAGNVLRAIRELKKEEPTFEMYVMLGAWIDCKNAWSDREPDHNRESEQNRGEIERAVQLANEFPETVKIIAVGNEAMVKWATAYYVQPAIILKWVTHLQNEKKKGKLGVDVWITSSDNFASWGGQEEYRTADLEKLVRAVDFVSLHTYPMHDTHYQPDFWGIFDEDKNLNNLQQIDAAMRRSVDYAKAQYQLVVDYVRGIDDQKPIHIGETGWATQSKDLYGEAGSKATDEYKQALYHNALREWTEAENISCFYFEAFDEKWKDAENPLGSENHFGLFTVEGNAKYVLWEEVDKKTFLGLGRNANPVQKTFAGDKDSLLIQVQLPPKKLKTQKEPAL